MSYLCHRMYALSVFLLRRMSASPIMQPHAREDEHARARITVCSFPHVSLSSRNRYRVATFLDCALETNLDNLLIRASIPAETFEEGLRPLTTTRCKGCSGRHAPTAMLESRFEHEHKRCGLTLAPWQLHKRSAPAHSAIK